MKSVNRDLTVAVANTNDSLPGKGIWGSMVALDQAVQRAVVASATQGGTPEALEAGHDLDLALQMKG